MEYRKLGKWGMKVSELSLGTYMTYGQAHQREAAAACVKAAVDLGINCFDTADVYGNRFGHTGVAEEILGDLLSPYRRGGYVLSTKLGYPIYPEDINSWGLSRKHVLEACEDSLRRLKTDYIDIYFMHLYDTETPVEETMDALDTLVRQGKVLYTGVSNWSVEQIGAAQAYAHGRNIYAFSAVQPAYNMFDRKIEAELLPYCAKEGLGVTSYFPLAQGVLAGRYTSVDAIPKDSRAADSTAGAVIQAVGALTAENLAKVEKLKKIAADAGLEVAQLALAWILRRPEISTILVGASRPAQLEANAKAAGVKLTPDTVEAIEAVLMD